MSLILTPETEIDAAAVLENGVPYLTGTYIGYLITTNMGITAGFVHMFLWNYDDVKAGWSFLSIASLQKLLVPSTWIFLEGREVEGTTEARKSRG